MSGRRLLWAPQASRDLNSIWQYFASVASDELADRLIQEIYEAATRTLDRPHIGRRRDDILPGIRSVRVHPYAVFYRVTENAVEVARVLHERRDLPSAIAKPDDDAP